jgi:hypothetical protein
VGIEQLTYTWARRGLNGAGLLQPVGASAGMWPETTRLHQLALRLCRYDRPPGAKTTPISYGWLDSGDIRFAFYRTFLTHDQAGHPGNFAAHILAGPQAELPAERLLVAVGAPWWWTHPMQDDTVGRLPRLDPDVLWNELPDARPAHPPGSEELLARILSGEAKITVPITSAELIATMAGIANRLPHLVNERTFSNFEHGPPARWFDTCGTSLATNAAAPAPSSLVARGAARYVFNPAATTSLLRRIWCDGKESTPSNLQRFTAITAALGAIYTKPDHTAADLLPALRSADAIAEVLGHHGAQHTIARALTADDLAVTRALRDNQRFVPSDIWHEIGILIDRELGHCQVTAGLATSLDILPLEVLGALAFERLQRLSGSADPTGDALARWPAPLLRAALRSPQLPKDERMYRAVLTASRHHGPDNWLGDTSIPLSARILLLAGLSAQATFPAFRVLNSIPDVISHTLSDEPELFARLLTGYDPHPGAQLLGDALKTLVASRQRRTHLTQDHLDLLASVLGSIAPRRRLTLIIATAQAFIAEGAGWANLVESAVASFAEDLLDDPTQAHSTDLLHAAATAGSGSGWYTLLKTAQQSTMGSQALRRRLGEMPGPDARLGAAYVVDARVASGIRTRNDVTNCETLLYAVGLAQEEVAEVLITAATRAIHLHRNAHTADLVLSSVGDMAIHGHLLMGHTGTSKTWRRRDPDGVIPPRIADLAGALYARLFAIDRNKALNLVAAYTDTGKPGKLWKNTLRKR